jgi:phospholipase D-like protein/parallel beta helix pectate lyase-like protein
MRRPLRAALALALVAPALALLSQVLLPTAVRAQDGSEVGPGRETPPALPGDTVLVPQDAPTIQAAVDAAEPGGLVLVSPGVYREAVVVTTPFVTIRGIDRNETILDGAFELDTAIRVVEADGVTIENLTARNYLVSGFLWSSVFGYRGSYLTAYNDGAYGLFAFDSVYGQFDHSYASGHPDSGFYIGQCQPCHAVVTDVLAENNAIGFSGTNAGGELFVVNSEWRNNMSGIVPNSLDSEELAPQRDAVIAGNWVHDNNNADAPSQGAETPPALGIGIAVMGGRDNVVTQNLVEDHVRFGIALLPLPDDNVWLTEDNVVRDNLIRTSGNADLAISAPAAGGDCFSGNDFATSLPAAIEWRNGCGSWLRSMAGGSVGAAIGPLTQFLEASFGEPEVGDWRTQPEPPPQENMPGAEQAPPDPASPGVVPHRIQIRDARVLDVPASSDVSQEVTVLGLPLATSLFGILIGLYAYALPLILYASWISIALWDLVRQEAVPNGVRVGWMAAVIAVPVLGPIAYYAFGRSPIQRSLRVMLVAGGLGIYVALAALAVALGA